MAVMTPMQIANQLWPVIRTGTCIAWVGAGLSLQAKYPGWGQLVSELCKACDVPALGEDETQADAFIDKAEECKVKNEGAYKDVLARSYGRKTYNWRNAYNMIMDLPFHTYVTTNFDPILSTVGSTKQRPLHAYPALLPKHLYAGTHAIVYLHGIANVDNRPTGEDLVLSRSEFTAAYERGAGSFLYALLCEYPVLYVGSGVREPSMVEVFRRVKAAQADIARLYPEATPPKSFALVPTHYRKSIDGSGNPVVERDHESEAADESRYNSLGITPLWYDPADPKAHSEIEEVLGCLCELADRMRPPKPSFKYGEDLPNG